MLELVSEKINDPQFMFSILIAIAAVATVLTVAMPMLESDTLGKRMKAVSIERDRIRARERERIGSKQAKPALRQDSTALVKSLVENFNLSKWLSTEQAEDARKEIDRKEVQRVHQENPDKHGQGKWCDEAAIAMNDVLGLIIDHLDDHFDESLETTGNTGSGLVRCANHEGQANYAH